MATYTRPAPGWLVNDPDRLEDAQRSLVAQGITGDLSLMADGTLVLESDADPGDLVALVPVRHPERVADDDDRALLIGYLQTPAPGGAATVEALKTLIRVVGRLAKRV